MKILLQGTKFRFGTCLMENKPVDLILKTAIVVTYLMGKGGKKGSKNLGYIYHGINWNPIKILNAYRSRFSIESSYRMRNKEKTKNIEQKSSNPVFVYPDFIPTQKYMDGFTLDIFLTDEKRVQKNKSARFSIWCIFSPRMGIDQSHTEMYQLSCRQ